MSVLVRCPSCPAALRVQPGDLGHPVRCPRCGHIQRPQSPAGVAAPPPPPKPPAPARPDPAAPRQDDRREDRPPRKRPPEPEPRRGSNRLTLVLAALAAVAGVMVVGCGVGGYFLYHYLGDADEPVAREVAANPPAKADPPAPPPPAKVTPPMKAPVTPTPPVAPPTPAPIPPAPPVAPTVVRFPAAVSHVYPADGGRLLIFRLPQRRQIVSYDVAAGRTVGTVAGVDPLALVAGGGRGKVFVARADGRIVRLDLRTGAQEVATTLAPNEAIRHIAAPTGADGPLAVVSVAPGGRPRLQLLDPDTLVPLTFPVEDPARPGLAFPVQLPHEPFHIGVSADGRAVSCGDRVYTRTATGYRAVAVNPSSGLLPAPDGKALLGNSLVGEDGRPVRFDDYVIRWFLPAAGGPFFLSVEYGGGPKRRLLLHAGQDRNPLGELPGGDAVRAWLGVGRSVSELHRHLVVLPDPGLVVFVTGRATEAQLFPVDMPALLRRAGRDVTFTSAPPAAAPAKGPYTYAAAAATADGLRPTFALRDTPSGVAVSPDGKLTWEPGPARTPVAVRLVARTAAGKEAEQAFEILPPSAQELALAANPPPVRTVPVPSAPTPVPRSPVPPAPMPVPRSPVPPAVEPPAGPGRAATEVPLPGAAESVVVGGAGRYVLAVVPSASQVAVFDVAERKLVKALPTGDVGHVLVAAGIDKAFTLDRRAWVLRRWDLATQALELTVSVPPEYRQTHSVIMGSAATGPLWLVHDGRVTALDPWSLRPLDVEQGADPAHPLALGRMDVRASADGRTLGAWKDQGTEGGVLRLTGQKLEGTIRRARFGHLVPGPDGKVVYAAGGPLDPSGEPPAQGGNRRMTLTLPAAEGSSLYLSVTEEGNGGNPGRLAVHHAADGRLVADLPWVDLGRMSLLDSPDLAIDRRYMLLPSAGLLVMLPSSNNKLLLRPLDLDAGLAAAGKDYLFVDAPAAGPAVRGKAFTQALTIKSGAGGVRVKVDAGPPGLTVAADGNVTWAVPKDFAGAEVTAAITVTDAAGRAAPYALRVAVRDDPPAGAGAGAEPRAAGAAPAPTLVDLPGPVRDAVPAAGGRLLALHLPGQRQVALFDPAAGAVVKYLPAPEEEAVIAAGRDHLFVASPGAKTLRRYSLKTLEKEATPPLPDGGVVTGLCMGSASTGPLLICRKGADVGPLLVDPLTLKPVPGSDDLTPEPAAYARASADGRLLVWLHGPVGFGGSQPTTVVEMKDGRAEVWAVREQQIPNIPSPDGRRVYIGPGVYDAESYQFIGDPKEVLAAGRVLPAVTGGMTMRFAQSPGWDARFRPTANAPIRLDLYLPGQRRPFASVDRVWEMHGPPRPAPAPTPVQLDEDRRYHLFPEAGRLVVIQHPYDRLVVHRVGVDELLAQSPVDYLVVTSEPPSEAVRGATVTYAPVVRSRKGGVRVRLRSGPPGMTFADGRLVWRVPADFGDDDVEVVVAATNVDGQEVTQTFTLPVRTRSPGGN